MTYALNLGEDGRVLSATFAQYAPEGAPRVDALPEGDVADYRYVDGGFIYDPLPKETLSDIDEIALLRAQVAALTDRGEFLEDCIAEMAMLVYA